MPNAGKNPWPSLSYGVYDCKLETVKVFNEQQPYWRHNKEERKCWWKCGLAKSWIKMFIKPLTPGASRRKLHFLLILEIFCLKMAKLAPIYLKRHLQYDSMPFLLLAPRFYFCLSVIFFSYLFAAVIERPLDLLPVQNFPRKHHWDGQFLPRR